MIQSSKAITLVLVSAASILGGYHAFQSNYDDRDEYFNSTTRPSGYSHSSYYSHGHYWGGGYSSSGSGYAGGSGMHGTSHGGFGGTGHASGS